MKLTQYQVDAFARRPFEGNPAAVCPLERWLPDALMQSMTAENNLSETAFFVPTADGFHLRWFAPAAEVDLCGHATLASAHVLFHILGYAGERIVFSTRSGALAVERRGELLAMDFPALPPSPVVAPAALAEALGGAPVEVLAAKDYLVVLESEVALRALSPDMGRLAALDRRAVCVTAPAEDADFVSRFFAPKVGIPEDPVTGSAHCMLAPYWSARLGKTKLAAKQVSKRGGELLCALNGERVEIAGRAVTVMTAEWEIETT